MGTNVALLIPLFPFLAFLFLLMGKKWSKPVIAGMGIVATGLSFLLTLPLVWNSAMGGPPLAWQFPWLSIEDQMVQLSVTLGPLQVLMLLIVTSVSLLVQIYSYGYMHADARFHVFYAYLSLFTCSMLGLVMSANLLQIYVFWELVGVCSFLLVGFWYMKPEAKKAAKKAFIVTRIGDIGLFIAICLIFWRVGSFEVDALAKAVSSGQLNAGWLSLVAILIFVGAVGKSGQFPLHTWLPDAMEGPTPVSALIHAATMVAAGVYLVANLFFLFAASDLAMDVVAYVGGFTALFAATIGIAQTDIKRVLAYSTVSQLGYMMLALGSAGYTAGVFHLTTHAFFKALLFLAAGAVITAFGHQQDLRQMGGLWKTHRWLGVWFLIGCLSIAGIPPFAGFFSKDEILAAVYQAGRMDLFAIGLLAAFFTAFYMFRLFFLAFAGESRGQAQTKAVPTVMMAPLAVLAVMATASGLANLPGHWFDHWLAPGSAKTGVPLWLPVVAILVSVLGIGLATMMYGVRKWDAAKWAKAVPWLHRLVLRKYYVDEFYQVLVVWPLKGFGWVLNGWDRFVIGGLVHLSGWFMSAIGGLGSRLQTGQAQTYALISVIGLVLLFVGLTAGRLFQ
ncbi:NADH dehydrogenase subunit L [Laceyella sacchari]|uniref:NADH-quinone oxidoreductase subunit L n=1 Tax=Laceyella sacchari TaxID=37482 RepID=UPI00104C6137|nr:NADH-quinone oxidoreductase subunit L [Laceyella sacchari]TCW39244.1 NADH dehydrogenase subunit L [Laceyella sacchari]